jgi:class 3 adenylate cyclase
MKKSTLTLAAIALSAMAFTSCASKSQQAAAARGFETVTTPATELEDMKRDMESKYIPCGIGIGESTDEMVARNVSADESRTDLAKSMSTYVQRLSEQYAQNVSSEAKKIWEEGVRQLTDKDINGATVYKTVTQYNGDSNRYKIYSLIVLSPEVFKKAVMAASANQEELELRVKKDDMMKKLDAGVADYEAKYKR